MRITSLRRFLSGIFLMLAGLASLPTIPIGTGDLSLGAAVCLFTAGLCLALDSIEPK